MDASRRQARVGFANSSAALPSVGVARFGALAVVEGGLFALVVCVSRCPEPVRAGMAAGAAASLEGAGDPRAPARVGDPAPAGRPTEADPGRSCSSGVAQPFVDPASLGRLSDQAGDTASLAPPACRAPLDIRAPNARATTARALAAPADPSSRRREPAVGIQTDRRRAQGSRHLCFGDLRAQGAARGRSPAGAPANALAPTGTRGLTPAAQFQEESS